MDAGPAGERVIRTNSSRRPLPPRRVTDRARLRAAGRLSPVALGASLVILPISHASAQLSPGPRARVVVGADATLATRDVWRGLIRTEGAVLQPAGWIAIARGRNLLSIGAWSARALRAADRADEDFEEVDAWIEIGRRQSHIDWSIGLVVHDARSGRPIGSLSADLDTREVRGRVSLREGGLRNTLNLTPSVLVVWDAGDVGGTYVEVDVEYAATLLPEPRAIPLASLFFGVTGGWSAGMAARAQPTAPGYYVEDGLTHVQTRASVSIVPFAGLPVAVHVFRHDRFAGDAAARRVRADPGAPEQGHVGWWEFTLSVRADGVRVHD